MKAEEAAISQALFDALVRALAEVIAQHGHDTDRGNIWPGCVHTHPVIEQARAALRQALAAASSTYAIPDEEPA